MAIFTPESKFMHMMKTTLDTNRYFMENNMEKYYNNKDIESSSEDSIEKDTPINDIPITEYKEPAYYTTNTFNELNDSYKEIKSFTEQQIKLNKQTKNNFDRLNKKINHNTDSVSKQIRSTEENLWQRLIYIEGFIDQRFKSIDTDIEEKFIYFDDKINKLTVLISFGIISNMILFAYLILVVFK